MTMHPSDTEAQYRSLLQKAVRRGNVDLVYTTSALLDSMRPQHKNWYRTCAAIITFEECWPLGAELFFTKKFYSKVAALIKVARSAKSRDAAGLGYLAHALGEGETSVLNGTAEDRHLRAVAKAIKCPEDFWLWIRSQQASKEQTALVDNTIRFKNEGSPRDKAVFQAAAYLAVTTQAPTIKGLEPSDQAFPFWVTFDPHTTVGKIVMRDVARDLHIALPQLEWTSFFFEGGQTNAEIPSPWWDRYCRWNFNKIRLPPEEAHLLWEPAKPQVMAALADDSRRLRNDLYQWKLSNLGRIESLKRQVELFIGHFDDVQQDQQQLF
jgi:hypothetical protein